MCKGIKKMLNMQIIVCFLCYSDKFIVFYGTNEKSIKVMLIC